MSAAPAGWTVSMRDFRQVRQDCDCAIFEVAPPAGEPVTVEVRTTAQVEHILARELGKETLSVGDRQAILSVAGRWLIEERVATEGAVEPLLLLDSQLFQAPGAERRLLRRCELLAT